MKNLARVLHWKLVFILPFITKGVLLKIFFLGSKISLMYVYTGIPCKAIVLDNLLG